MPDLDDEIQDLARRRRESGREADALEAEIEQAEADRTPPAATPDHARDGGVI